MKVTTSERLQSLMAARNLRQADILDMIQPYCKKYDVKIPRNALSQYVTGKVLPKQDKLTILGLALGVSEVWLMGYDVPMEREKPAPEPSSSERDEITALFASLSDENQKRLLDYAQVLLKAQQAENDSQA
ncbi:MAG: hypothetical protein IKO07_06345 [Clostridia bacterium]|nr:hypothetical protein [Clostridia bacterium]